ncbi:MAG: hypothetical protein WBG54_14920 [Acidobacteriaceae bacterium]
MTNPSRRFENRGRNLDERLLRIEDDGKSVIDYLNKYIVPEMRRSSSKAVRAAAGRLTRPAEQLDRRHGA